MKLSASHIKNPNPVSRNSASKSPAVYPFSAIVGQDEMKLALILNVVDPLIGGVLIMGHRGTGKSTAVRALADLLPDISVVAGCTYRCDPKIEEALCVVCKEKLDAGTKLKKEATAVSVVELPLGATEDRVSGTIDIERALNHGMKAFEPGLLGRANRGFLYIDEVNLLEDHLVDLLLDVAVTGVNKVEREGISIEHPARFVLIGSGNPEEGELRPQLLDRFGLHTEVKTEDDLDQRVAIIENREAFDRDPERFRQSFASQQQQLRDRITWARKHFAGVKVERPLLRRIAQICSDLKVDGHRGELTIMRSARALAAFEGRKKVSEDDVKAVAVMSLRHRLRRDALEEVASSQRIERTLERVLGDNANTDQTSGLSKKDSSDDNGQNQNDDRPQPSRGSRRQPSNRQEDQNERGSADLPFEFASPRAMEGSLPKLNVDPDLPRARFTTRAQLQSKRADGVKQPTINSERGRYARAVTSKGLSRRIALDATLRALLASRIQGSESTFPVSPGNFKPVTSAALRYKLLKQKHGTLFIFAVDTSGSMALNRIAQAKGAILQLLRRSYLNRDSVAIVAFNGKVASVSLPPSRSILRARRVLDSLPMGGSTPLSAALIRALELSNRVRDKHAQVSVLLFTDGNANVLFHAGKHSDRVTRQKLIDAEIVQLGAALRKAQVKLTVVDTRRSFASNSDARNLSELLAAPLVRLE